MEYLTVWKNNTLAAAAEIAENTPAPADLRLVEAVLAGDESAYEKIFDRYKSYVAAVAAKYFDCPAQVDEMIQTVFVKAFFELKDFRGTHENSMASWLGKITVNACLDVLRSRRRKPETPAVDLSERETEILFATNENAGENDLVRRDLARKLLANLAAEDRAILQMLDVEEMNVREVAELTGWSKSKIKIRAFRARHALRKIAKKFL